MAAVFNDEQATRTALTSGYRGWAVGHRYAAGGKKERR